MSIKLLMNTLYPATITIILLMTMVNLFAQNELQVKTLSALNASGGLSKDATGNIYVSDFGAFFGATALTKVYQIDKTDLSISIFAEGFEGASGANFDHQGNFYQSNPIGNKVSKISPDETIEFDWATGLATPVGIAITEDNSLIVCNCGENNLQKIDTDGNISSFAESDAFSCPNGITKDEQGNFYVCNFNDGKILHINPEGAVSILVNDLPVLLGGPSPVGSGHLTYSNGFLYVALIGVGQIFQVDLEGNTALIAGQAFAGTNIDGPALQATFTKPNGIVASNSGDTLFVNCSVPNWITNPSGLHPAMVRMVTGVCSLPNVDCGGPVSSTSALIANNEMATLSPLAPNPVQEIAQVQFEIKSNAKITLQITDSLGRVMQVLHNGSLAAGKHAYSFNRQNLKAGFYFVNLTGHDFQLTQKFEITR